MVMQVALGKMRQWPGMRAIVLQCELKTTVSSLSGALNNLVILPRCRQAPSALDMMLLHFLCWARPAHHRVASLLPLLPLNDSQSYA